MASINQKVSNLIGGVSQQPDPIKLPGQVVAADNVLLDPTFGCRKRPPTKFIKRLATDVPDDAYWFPIMRDNQERYVAAVYKAAGVPTVRVWEADTGTERTVTLAGSASDYLNLPSYDPTTLTQLSINDYTLLASKVSKPTMVTNQAAATNHEALVVVNQVAYDTTYRVDFLRDGTSGAQVKTYRAKKISVSPASFEVEDGTGACALAATQAFTMTSGAKTGLGFTLTAQCAAEMVRGETLGDYYPTRLKTVPSGFDWGVDCYGTAVFGEAALYPTGTYLYRDISKTTAAGDIDVQIELRVIENSEGKATFELASVQIKGYTIGSSPWDTSITFEDKIILPSTIVSSLGKTYPVGDDTGYKFQIDSVLRAPSTPTYDYKSVYRVKAELTNGGIGWVVGDQVPVTMAGKQYTVTVEEDEFIYVHEAEHTTSFTTAATGTLDVRSIVSGLVTAINALAEYTATAVGNVIHIIRDADTREFNINTSGGTVDNALYGIKDTVRDISLLPGQCVAGVVLKIANTAEADADDYWVKFVPTEGDIPGHGAWEETVKPGLSSDLNPATMPHALIRLGNGDFTLRPLSKIFDENLYWKGRAVGDDSTNPEPSFVGHPILDIFFYRNRLGLVTRDTVVMGQPGDYLNFFQGSAIAVSDSDPLDFSVSSTSPAELKAAIGTPQGVLLFGSDAQFLLSAQDVAFGPLTTKLDEVSRHACDMIVPPVETGVSLMWPTATRSFTKVYEMAVASLGDRPLVAETTRVCPEFIPKDVNKVAASPANFLVMYGTEGSKKLYVFKFFNVGAERSVAGWATWSYSSQIEMISCYQDQLYLVCRNGTDSILLRSDLQDDPDRSAIDVFGRKFLPRLDHYSIKQDVVTVDNLDGTHKLRFPAGAWVDDETVSANVVYTSGGLATYSLEPSIEQDGTGYYVNVDSDLVEEEFLLGIEYKMSLTLPRFYFRNENRPDQVNNVVVDYLYLDLYLSGRYEVLVERLGYEPATINIDIPQADVYLGDAPALTEVGTFPVPVFCRGDMVKITVSSLEPMPSSIISYSWSGQYSTRGVRMG